MQFKFQKYFFNTWYQSLTAVLLLTVFLNTANSATLGNYLPESFFLSENSDADLPSVSAESDQDLPLFFVEITEVEESEVKNTYGPSGAVFVTNKQNFAPIINNYSVDNALNLIPFLSYPALYLRYCSIKIPCLI